MRMTEHSWSKAMQPIKKALIPFNLPINIHIAIYAETGQLTMRKAKKSFPKSLFV